MAASFNPHLAADPVRAYVEALLDEAGFAHLPAAERADAVAALTAEAERRIGIELFKALDAHSREAAGKMLARGAAREEIAAFFDVRLQEAAVLTRQALSDFGEECRSAVRDAA